MNQFVQITTTCDQQPVLEKIARQLVEQRLAACVQVSGPVVSTYRWQDAVETATEWLCTIKTSTEKQTAVVELVRELHSYDEPEVIVTPISGGSQSYLEWLAAQVE